MTSERGSTLVLAAISLTGLMFLTALGLDIGLGLVAKSQAQTAADAGAIAGAIAVSFGETPVPAALVSARANLVLKRIPDVSVSQPCPTCVAVDVSQDVASSIFQRTFHVRASSTGQVRPNENGEPRVVVIR